MRCERLALLHALTRTALPPVLPPCPLCGIQDTLCIYWPRSKTKTFLNFFRMIGYRGRHLGKKKSVDFIHFFRIYSKSYHLNDFYSVILFIFHVWTLVLVRSSALGVDGQLPPPQKRGKLQVHGVWIFRVERWSLSPWAGFAVAWLHPGVWSELSCMLTGMTAVSGNENQIAVGSIGCSSFVSPITEK